MEDEPQLDTVLRAIDNNTCHVKEKERKKKEMWYIWQSSAVLSSSLPSKLSVKNPTSVG